MPARKVDPHKVFGAEFLVAQHATEAALAVGLYVHFHEGLLRVKTKRRGGYEKQR